MIKEEDFIDAEIINRNVSRNNVSDIEWRTKDYRLIRLGDMEDKHIRNCALLLTNFGYQQCSAAEPVRLGWLRAFSMEWQRRMLERENKTKRFRVYPDPWSDRFDRALDEDLDDLPGLLND